MNFTSLKHVARLAACVLPIISLTASAQSDNPLPIADAHVHYSHDSVVLTPPERVIELMREANLKFALVSSSDDNGTQLLSELAPDLIVPGLRPYRRRGELSSWYTDPDALAYVEKLLASNRYATIGEFHLSGKDVELEIPRRIVELADEHNLILHAHSDAEAIDRLLAQSDTVKVLWAHSGFDSPENISLMLAKHDRLWADLAFRSEVGSGGLSEEWKKLFTTFPDRLMLGTDTYTPERIYFIPDNAASARVWLTELPDDIAENIAWRNAYNLLMPVWEKNRSSANPATDSSLAACKVSPESADILLQSKQFVAVLSPQSDITVSAPFTANVTICSSLDSQPDLRLSATMPAHGHGMNYVPEVTLLSADKGYAQYEVGGLVLHMPGHWQWEIEVQSGEVKEILQQEFILR